MIRRNSKFMLVASIFIFIFISFSAIFLYKQIQKNSRLAIDVEKRIKEFDSQLRSLKIFEDFISNTKTEREKIESTFVKQSNQDDFLVFIKDLENAGENIGLNVDVVSTSQAFDATNKGPSLHLTAKGNFSQVFKYSLLLENLPYELLFESISFSKRDEGMWEGDYVIRLLSYEL